MRETRKINKVFIANRGEICRRIAETAKKMGIKTVAITDKDNPPLFLRSCVDEFIKVDEEMSSLYLDAEKMISFAKSFGCDAIHPGFGFLSENAEFAQGCEDNGITWIGPPPEAISALANKAKARAIAENAKIPCTPGLENFQVPSDESGDFSVLEGFAEKTGFPLLLKAAMGGGGKGMRLVREMSELKSSAIRAASEGLSSFGDASLICERFVETSRHVEVQIMADKHGNVYAVGDRDCSVQRRHQKILEESPAPFLGDETRKILHESAVALAKEVGYYNAGTVEFLVEWTKEVQGKDLQPVFFLEMNTRLQVEHPVTEEVHGVDLVECQFKVAMGEVLNSEIFASGARGHAIEARLYAENVKDNFFPSPGKVKAFLPYRSNSIRWEVGIDSIDEITPKFDPMISKIIGIGQTREESLENLAKALDKTVYIGPPSNREYLVAILKDTVFKNEAVSTHFIDEVHDGLIRDLDSKQEDTATKYSSLLKSASKSNLSPKSNISSVSNPSPSSIMEHVFFGASKTSDFEIIATSEESIETYPSEKISKSLISHDGRKSVVTSYLAPDEKTTSILLDGTLIVHTENYGLSGSGASGAKDDEIAAEVPGKVLDILVEVGTNVKKDEKLFILESMKMEFEVKAAKEGTISEVNVSVGEQVQSGKVLAHWEE
jgi:acetyl/propionyl-CoA carboxylase alpha subunit